MSHLLQKAQKLRHNNFAAEQGRSAANPMTSQDSGRIELQDEDIVYWFRDVEAWRVPVDAMRAFGEFTVSSFAEDYFFAVVTGDRNGWYQASFYAEGRDKFLKDLGMRLGLDLNCSLCNVTDFHSVIMWPPSLAGTPMFELQPTAGFWGKIGWSKVLSLCPAVRTLSAQ